MLYASFGHGAGVGEPIIHGQNPAELYSALIRINVDGAFPYSIPNDNPFGNEVYAYGFRNPFACNPDRATGEVYCADVGEDQREEIDRIVPGGNYGFFILEGSACFPAGTPSCTPPLGYVAPVIEYDHTVGTSVQSATIYRGHKINDLRGVMFVADFGSPGIFPANYFGFKRTSSGWSRFTFNVTGIRFGEAPVTVIEDEKGELYFTTISLVDYQTRIYKVVDATVPR
jgi:glucose/arabinose dehydrogenase